MVCCRFMNTSLIDCDVQPTYVCVIIKGKVISFAHSLTSCCVAVGRYFSLYCKKKCPPTRAMFVAHRPLVLLLSLCPRWERKRGKYCYIALINDQVKPVLKPKKILLPKAPVQQSSATPVQAKWSEETHMHCSIVSFITLPVPGRSLKCLKNLQQHCWTL